MKDQNFTASPAAVEQISVDKLDAIIAEKRFILIDVRDPKAIENQGAIPGAINIPLDSVDQVIQDSSNNMHHVFTGNRPLLFCCTGGVMSYAAALKAGSNGISQLYNLEGGHSAWMKLKEAQATSEAA